MDKKLNLEEKLKEIDAFFENLSLEEFEKMALESGLGKIRESSDCSYVLAVKGMYEGTYVNDQKHVNVTKDNEFHYQNDNILKGAA